MPFFSIVIPTYNRAHFIGKAIDSVLNQTFSDWEVIIIDDAATDTTKEIVGDIIDSRIYYYVNEKNLDRSISRNRGIDLAKGKFICFLDSDDYYLPNHLETLYNEIKINNFEEGFYFTKAIQVNVITGVEKTIDRIDTKINAQSVINEHVPIHTVAIYRSIFTTYRFDSTLRINEDVFLFAQIAASFPSFYINIPTVVWVIHDNNTNQYVKDYYAPQLIAIHKIFSDSKIKPQLNYSFVKKYKFEILSNYIHWLSINKKLFKALYYWFGAFLLLPTNRRNKTNLGNILYNLPFLNKSQK